MTAHSENQPLQPSDGYSVARCNSCQHVSWGYKTLNVEARLRDPRGRLEDKKQGKLRSFRIATRDRNWCNGYHDGNSSMTHNF